MKCNCNFIERTTAGSAEIAIASRDDLLKMVVDLQRQVSQLQNELQAISPEGYVTGHTMDVYLF